MSNLLDTRQTPTKERKIYCMSFTLFLPYHEMMSLPF